MIIFIGIILCISSIIYGFIKMMKNFSYYEFAFLTFLRFLIFGLSSLFISIIIFENSVESNIYVSDDLFIASIIGFILFIIISIIEKLLKIRILKQEKVGSLLYNKEKNWKK